MPAPPSLIDPTLLLPRHACCPPFLLCPLLQALAALRDMGKRLLFVTNNSSKSRQQYVAKFAALGIQAEAHEIVPSSYGAAAYLESIGFKGVAFLVGGLGVEQELQAAGIKYVMLPPPGDSSNSGGGGWTVESLRELQLASGIEAVVVGFDEHFSYEKLCYASACLREIPGCHFVATNRDHADNLGRDERTGEWEWWVWGRALGQGCGTVHMGWGLGGVGMLAGGGCITAVCCMQGPRSAYAAMLRVPLANPACNAA